MARPTTGMVLGAASSCRCVRRQCGGGRSVDSGAELQEWLIWLLQVYGAALCVVERPHGDGAGAGEGGRGRALQGPLGVRFSGCILVSLGCHSAGADGPSTRGGAAGVHVWVVQVDGAAPCVELRPHGDGDVAGEGGRGRALQGRLSVRFSGCILSSVGHCAGQTVRPLGAGAAGVAVSSVLCAG
jgi:hypothetical protein